MSVPARSVRRMLIDCDTCPAAGPGCRECAIGILLDRPPVRVELDAAERRALRELARVGLVTLPPGLAEPEVLLGSA